MKKHYKIYLIIFVILIIAGLSFFVIRYNQKTFVGERIKNPDSYLLDIRKMNGSDNHSMDLKKGASLKISFETYKGTLNLKIVNQKNEIVYEGNGKVATNFTIDLPSDDSYTFFVKAKWAKGYINISVK